MYHSNLTREHATFLHSVLEEVEAEAAREILRLTGRLPDDPKLGHKSAHAPKLHLGEYLSPQAEAPSQVHRGLFRGYSNVLGNDRLGDCHDDQTEVLTEHGWSLWADYDGTSTLGTMNQETGRLEFQAPIAVQRKNYDGPMYFADHRRLDFAVTPGHRFLHRPYIIPKPYIAGGAGYGSWRMTTTQKLPFRFLIPGTTSGFAGAHLGSIEIGRRSYSGDDFLALVALVVSDGYVRADRHRISFCCFREDRLPLVRDLAMRLKISESGSRGGRRGVWEWTDEALWHWLRANCYADDRLGSLNKRVPNLVKCASEDQIRLFLEFFGDQHVSDKGRQFFTSSPGLAADLQELLLRIGTRGGLNRRLREVGGLNDRGQRIESKHPSFTITENGREDVGLLSGGKKGNLVLDRYQGEVFCATVPNSTLVTRRNGKILVSGNCGPASVTHGTEGMHHAAGSPIPPFVAQDTIDFYEVAGGYVPGDPSTDQGVDNDVMMAKWKDPGLKCAADGSVHTIIESVGIDPTNDVEWQIGIYEFAAVFCPLAMPMTAQGQRVWDVIGDGQTGNSAPGSWGGHDVCGMAFSGDEIDVNSWGLWIRVTAAFRAAYAIKPWFVVVSKDMLGRSGVSPTGLDWTRLVTDLQKL